MRPLLIFIIAQISGFGYGQVIITQEEVHLAIIKKGQKIFLERNDYLQDKIFRVTDNSDTVTVLEADRSFFRFKKGEFIGWALTAQIDSISGISTVPVQYLVKTPFQYISKSNLDLYNLNNTGEKVSKFRKGKQLVVLNSIDGFLEVKKGKKSYYIKEGAFIPKATLHPILKAMREIKTGQASSWSSRSFIRGPKGGCYYIGPSGKRIYVDRSYCN